MKHFIKSIFTFTAIAGMHSAAFAQAAEATPSAVEKYSPYTDPVFYALAAVALILLVFILQLQKVFGGVARNFHKSKNSILPIAILILGLTQMPSSAFAAEQQQATFLHEGFGSNAFNALIFLIIFEMAVVVYYVRMIQLMLTKVERENATAKAHAQAKVAPSFWDKFNSSVAIEKEEAIMTDHDYDGIRELDNALPPWWKYGFYLTIVWSVAYLIHYHVSKTGPLSKGEYEIQLAEAEQEMEAYRKKAANLVDETTVTYLDAAADLAKGKEIFTSLCATCHGPMGEGKVGPNLTDAYWKHGGDIKDIFKTVKLGVSGTGMKSWKADMSPMVMAQVSSYILSLQGSNPAGGKAPEGDLFTPATNAPATDSISTTASKIDTVSVAVN